jgi:hypothetical protein
MLECLRYAHPYYNQSALQVLFGDLFSSESYKNLKLALKHYL